MSNSSSKTIPFISKIALALCCVLLSAGVIWACVDNVSYYFRNLHSDLNLRTGILNIFDTLVTVLFLLAIPIFSSLNKDHFAKICSFLALGAWFVSLISPVSSLIHFLSQGYFPEYINFVDYYLHSIDFIVILIVFLVLVINHLNGNNKSVLIPILFILLFLVNVISVVIAFLKTGPHFDYAVYTSILYFIPPLVALFSYLYFYYGGEKA